ncbi:MAG: Lar family restriction alleviation protein [Bacteroidaceae bacterium]|nr:Lar family restriction alleviation protein [Bacteroidaceae bacterium]
MKTPDLKPCPFCGCVGNVTVWYTHYAETLYKVECINSGCFIRPHTEFSPSRETVINFWNKRASTRKRGTTDENA